MPLTSYAVNEKAGCADSTGAREGAQRDQHRDARGAARPPDAGEGGQGGSGPGDLLKRPPRALRWSRRQGGARRAGTGPPDGLFAELYDELTSFPKPTVAACHGSVVGVVPRSLSPVTFGWAARISGCASRAPLARSAGRAGPAGHALRPRHRQVPAAPPLQRQRGRGPSHGARPSGRAGRRHRGRGARPRRGGGGHPPRRSPASRRCCIAGTEWSSAPLTRAGARWSGSGPGPACPTATAARRVAA